jgi:radical SAM/Cys-rich protein
MSKNLDVEQSESKTGSVSSGISEWTLILLATGLVMTFREKLENHGLALRRAIANTLQINVGFKCNLVCRHCHLEAGPERPELMNAQTIDAVIACARRLPFRIIDITGGSPELVPDLPRLITGIAPLTPKLIVRTNLVAIARPEFTELIELYRRHRISIVASLPSTSPVQTDAQRGAGVWEKSIAALKLLNALGYGREGTGLTLDLVANPAGAFLPPDQAQAERKFKRDLALKHDLTFTNLFTFANVPLGRFRAWLEGSGNLGAYLKKLEESFNPCTIPQLMCRTMVSVDWQGFVYDCDFNLAAGLQHSKIRKHVSELAELPPEGAPIAVDNHCYACTAGPGFT